MEQFHFETEWRLNAPIETLWHEIEDAESWHEWAPEIKRSFVAGPEEHMAPGSVVECELYSPLPYHVRVDLEVTEVDAPHKLAFHSTGDLVGEGCWHLEERNGETLVRYAWDLRPSGLLMGNLSKIGFVHRAVEQVHEKLAAGAYEGLQARISA